MPKVIARLLPLLLLVLFQPGSAGAQQPDHPPNLDLGDAVVTGFSGTVALDAATHPANKTTIDLTFINPDGPSARIVNIGQPGHVWDGRLLSAPKTFDVLAKDVGQVFGVALDDQTPPNIYVAATSVFGLNIVGRGHGGLLERRKKGGPGVGWMKGQFGLDLQGGPGGIYKIDGRTGVATLFANVTLDGVPNPGPGLGNLAYDSTHKQLFVSDLYTGMIHRFDLDGNERSRYDHGVAGLGAAKVATVPFDPKNRPNIANEHFDSEKPDTWGLAPDARRVWALAVHEDRLYYSVVAGPQVWSVGIEPDGSFASDPRWELDIPVQAGALPVSDIAFSHRGAMILAQRGLITGAYDYSAFTQPGEPEVLRFRLKDPNDARSPGRWKPAPEEYAVGFAGDYRNTNGSVALGYGYADDGALSTTACEAALWTTGQNLRNNPELRSQLEPGGPLVVHGLQGNPADLVRNANTPPTVSYFVDYADTFHDPRASGHIGSVRIYTTPCVPAGYVPPVAANPVGGGGGGGGGGPPPPPNACFAPTSLSLPPCTKPGQTVSLDLSTTSSAGVDPNWTVSPGGPPYHTSYSTWTVLANNWIQPAQSSTAASLPVGTYIYTRTFNLPCRPESYRIGSLKLTGYFGADNDGAPMLNGNPIPFSCPGPYCFSTPPGGTNFSHTGPSFFVQGLNSLTMTVVNAKGGAKNPTGLSVVAQLEASCGSECVCGCPPGTALEGKECVKVGSLIIEKEVTTHDTLVPWPAGTLFPMTLTCGPPANTTVTFNLANGGTYTANNIPFGSTCAVTETPLPAFPPNLCARGTVPVWSPPPTITPASVVINGTTVTVIVHNSVTCEPKRDGTLSVTKVVDPDPLNIGTSKLFPMTVTCTDPPAAPVSYPLNVHGNTSTVPTPVGVGSHCTVMETSTPSLPPGCHWLAPAYSPASVTIAGGLNQETVTNGYRCEILCPPPQAPNVDGICGCPPPMVTGAAPGTCVCPDGMQLVGGKCVKHIVCDPPLIPNADGSCGCPRGTVLRGKECVRPIDCRAPLIPNAAGTECVCRDGLVSRGGECVEVKQPKREQTCKRGFVWNGDMCVRNKTEPKEERPHEGPGFQIPRGMPGMGGGGGGGQRGGGGGGTPGR